MNMHMSIVMELLLLFQIEDLLMTLKSHLLQKVYLQVQSQRREERKAKVPIELWAELVQKISRPHEKTISSAFSQVCMEHLRNYIRHHTKNCTGSPQ